MNNLVGLAEAKDNQNYVPKCGARTHLAGLSPKRGLQFPVYEIEIATSNGCLRIK